MNNEPVAWKVIETDDEGSFTTFTEVEPVWTDNAIPLYLHPAKTLTDEEIEQIASQCLTAHAQFIGAGEVCYEGEIEFARAILKKAS